MKYTISYRSYSNNLHYESKTLTTNSLEKLQEKCHNILVNTRYAILQKDSLVVFPKEDHFTDDNSELFIRHNSIAYQKKTLVAMNVNPVVKSMFFLETKLDNVLESEIRHAYRINLVHFPMLDNVENEQLDLPFGSIDITDIRHIMPEMPIGSAIDVSMNGCDTKNHLTTFNGCLCKYSESDFDLIVEI